MTEFDLILPHTTRRCLGEGRTPIALAAERFLLAAQNQADGGWVCKGEQVASMRHPLRWDPTSHWTPPPIAPHLPQRPLPPPHGAPAPDGTPPLPPHGTPPPPHLAPPHPSTCRTSTRVTTRRWSRWRPSLTIPTPLTVRYSRPRPRCCPIGSLLHPPPLIRRSTTPHLRPTSRWRCLAPLPIVAPIRTHPQR